MVTEDCGYSILVDSDFLSESYIPEKPFGRENQVRELVFCLSSLLKSRRPIHAWLQGKSGTGKTLVAKYVLGEFRRQFSILGYM